MKKQYHIFGTEAVGRTPYYKCTDSEPEVLALVKTVHDGESIYGLRVVHGELLEFEPATVVETFRIKGSNDDRPANR